MVLQGPKHVKVLIQHQQTGSALGTVYFLLLYFTNDLMQLCNFNLKFQWLSDWKHVWLTSRGLPVDIFFVFGGLLASYSFMKDRSKGKKFNLATHFIHRYLRLTPALAIMLLFSVPTAE